MTDFAEGADNLLNMVSDQAYGDDNGVNWGYTSTPGASGAGDSQDMGSHTPGSFYNSGWWATSTGTIDYSFELEPGQLRGNDRLSGMVEQYQRYQDHSYICGCRGQ